MKIQIIVFVLIIHVSWKMLIYFLLTNQRISWKKNCSYKILKNKPNIHISYSKDSYQIHNQTKYRNSYIRRHSNCQTSHSQDQSKWWSHIPPMLLTSWITCYKAVMVCRLTRKGSIWCYNKHKHKQHYHHFHSSHHVILLYVTLNFLSLFKI